ncbi:NAD-dependent succinate-semialdehyde dehydrogenase [Ferrimicrobium sp.]|uniref:NAD-dependent succinate-semialdehyde dehydrogenase n=1 Tax=Ferrimicrobium sp. TaxID=2926050 RepID=UPI0026223827|nr:NAD-dependent succinate-semialdehyde dehydrogenase [Ferrimicrobium sp.]
MGTLKNSIETVISGLATGLYLDGEWIDAQGRKTFAVENPATGATLATVADGSIADAQRAIRSAGDNQVNWAHTPPRERSDILRRAYEMIMDRTDELSLLMTAEMGKPLAEARGEVAYGAEFLRWFSEEAVRISGDYTTSGDGKNRILLTRSPVGPSILITPWNFPLAMGTRKIGPAIASGCTMVFKPAPQTPLTSLALVQILREAGLPPGVLNVVTTTDAEGVVKTWMESGIARKVSFTGSTAVGKILLAQAAKNVMRTSMELGGNAPFIVFDDADLDRAVDGAMVAKLRNMGEACTAANRFLVHRSVADSFSDKLANRMSSLKVGDGTLAGVDIGPLVDGPALQKVESLVDDALSRGAEVVLGGSRPTGMGYFYNPTVLSNVSPDSLMMDTEIFGPVAPVVPFSDEAQALALANNTNSGLVGYVFTQDIDRALRLSDELEVGMVGVNTGIVSNPGAPFGGIKHSGLGREGGRLGIDEFLEYKYLAIPR